MIRLFARTAATIALIASANIASAQKADSMVERIQDTGVLRVCQIDYPPLNIKDPMTGEWKGLMIDMINDFAADLGVDVENVDTNWGTVVQSLKTNKCDISAGATYVNAKRAAQVMFTDTVTTDDQGAFVATDSDFTSYEELDQPGNVIAVISGSLNETNARATFKNAEIKLIVSDRQQTAILEVATKRADAAFLAKVAVFNFLANNDNVKVRPLDNSSLFASSIAWMLPLGEYHMRDVVNAWLISAKADGVLSEYEAKWFSVE